MRTGLHVWEKVTVDDLTSREGQDTALRLLSSHSPINRLHRVKSRATSYPGIATLEHEIARVEHHIRRPQNGETRELVHLALLALERGLDLLDTGRHLDAAITGEKFINRQGNPGIRDKTLYFYEVADAHPRKGPKALAGLIHDAAPVGDDGKSWFYKTEDGEIFDRERGISISLTQLESQISKARQRRKKTTEQG